MADPRPREQPAKTSPADPEAPSDSLAALDDDYLDEQEVQSFPASDAHSDWAGPGPDLSGDLNGQSPPGPPIRTECVRRP